MANATTCRNEFLVHDTLADQLLPSGPPESTSDQQPLVTSSSVLTAKFRILPLYESSPKTDLLQCERAPDAVSTLCGCLHSPITFVCHLSSHHLANCSSCFETDEANLWLDFVVVWNGSHFACQCSWCPLEGVLWLCYLPIMKNRQQVTALLLSCSMFKASIYRESLREWQIVLLHHQSVARI